MTQGRLAVITFHGMGSQVPFETTAMVVQCIERVAGPGAFRETSAALEPLGDRLLPRVGGVVACRGQTRAVDLFEVYWAPLTAGRVRLAESLWFYGRAGLRGLAYGLGRRFERRWNSRYYIQAIGWRTCLGLILGCNGLLLLSAWILSTELALALSALAVLGLELLPAALPFRLWAAAALLLGSLSLLLLLAIQFTPRPRPAAKETAAPGPAPAAAEPPSDGTRSDTAGAPGRMTALARWLATGGLATGPALLCLAYLSRLVPQLGAWLQATHAAGSWPGLAVIAGAAAVGTLLLLARSFLIEYTGDVAAYMSSHEVSRFADLRNQIQARGLEVLEHVYQAEAGSGPRYAEVVLLGHSLGSVVAYDAYNELLLRAKGRARDYARRTGTLLTFGSPLDKIAFIFRSQRPTEALDIREELATARQPVLHDRDLRPRQWLNLYARRDWVGGSVDFYHLLGGTPAGPGESVRNHEDPGAWNPAAAHAGYWRRKPLGKSILQALGLSPTDSAGQPRA